MPAVIAVTTFPEWAWDVYARKCIETWVQRWPGSILAYYEGTAPPAQIRGVEFRPLDMPERREFLQRALPKPPNWLHDAKRFCHKVFAQLDVASDYEQFWWLDSDVEMTSGPSDEKLQSLLNESFVTFLGRDTYTETGVIGFNSKHEGFDEFLDRYRSCYEEYRIFDLPYWTDCHAFDYARDGGGYDMTPGGKGFDNVLKISPLGAHMTHHKGKLKMQLEEQ